jgi:alpha-glucoside transport system substrate-binding protein
VKSLVWYSPEAFDEAGYEVPETLEELKALTEQIVADGGTPWCIGLGSGAATGWPATDWVEDMMLRTQPPEVYDAWVRTSCRSTTPPSWSAIEEYGWFVRNDAFVVGGAQAVATADFRDSPDGLFDFPPSATCTSRPRSSRTSSPRGSRSGSMPISSISPPMPGRDLGTPVLGSGGLIAITVDARSPAPSSSS